MRRLLFPLAAAACIGACSYAPPPAAASDAAARASLVAEAQGFMDSYARDLLAGDRAAIARRYHPEGAWFVGNGRKEHMSPAQIEALYAGAGWQPPKSFEWRDLSYEPAGPDAVIVAGTFRWGLEEGKAPIAVSYTGLLVRGGDGLRIRLEDESAERTR